MWLIGIKYDVSWSEGMNVGKEEDLIDEAAAKAIEEILTDRLANASTQ